MFLDRAPDEEATCPVCGREGRVYELRVHVLDAGDLAHARLAPASGGCLR